MTPVRKPDGRWQRYAKHTWKARVRASRKRLEEALGGKCQKCGDCLKLHFHHPHGRTWEPNKMNQEQRLRVYWRDFAAGRLGLLCGRCNRKDGAQLQKWYAERKRNGRTEETRVDGGGERSSM